MSFFEHNRNSHTSQENINRITETYPGLQVVSTYLDNGNIRYQLVSKDSVFVESESGPKSAKFRVNPSGSEEMSLTIPAEQKYPPAVPNWKRLHGLQEIYGMLFWSEVMNQVQEDIGNVRGLSHLDFSSSRSEIELCYTFEDSHLRKYGHMRSYSREVQFFRPAQEISTQIQQVGDALFTKVVNELAQDARLLGVYHFHTSQELEFTKAVYSDADDVALLVRGKFALRRRHVQDPTQFEKDDTVRLMTKQLKRKQEVDTSDAEWSAFIAYVVQANNMNNPYRG